MTKNFTSGYNTFRCCSRTTFLIISSLMQMTYSTHIQTPQLVYKEQYVYPSISYFFSIADFSKLQFLVFHVNSGIRALISLSLLLLFIANLCKPLKSYYKMFNAITVFKSLQLGLSICYSNSLCWSITTSSSIQIQLELLGLII